MWLGIFGEAFRAVMVGFGQSRIVIRVSHPVPSTQYLGTQYWVGLPQTGGASS